MYFSSFLAGMIILTFGGGKKDPSFFSFNFGEYLIDLIHKYIIKIHVPITRNKIITRKKLK
jgi:hypothetical protein